MSCIVYCASKMTGRDKQEMLDRAYYVCNVLANYGLTPISPVIEEEVKNEPGQLEQTSSEKLRKYWARDKHLIRNVAHVTLLDEAYRKSTGMEREYGYTRYCLWKPVVTIMPNSGYTVADFEDDAVVMNEFEAGLYISHNFGTRWKRIKWRLNMLKRSLPKWLKYQFSVAWR